MNKYVGFVSVTAVLAALAGPAYAFGCPGMVSQIDKALSAPSGLSQTQLDEVENERDEGEALHRAGQHAESVAVLEKALATLKGD
jgi:hypothetical protein